MTVGRFLFLSICIHLLIWLLVLKNAEDLRSKSEPIEVSIVDKPSKDDQFRRYVHGVIVPPRLKIKNDKLHRKYFGDEDQQVLKETKSPILGLTRNGLNGPPKEHVEKQNDGPSFKSLTDLDQTLFNGPSKNIYNLDVQDGLITLLNTERALYYTFFSRVEEKYFPLVRRACEDASEHLSESDRFKLYHNSLASTVDILLTPEGKYIRSVVLESTGLPIVDRILVKAAEDAAYFPNPPKELVKPDGMIHLKFGFRYFLTADAFARRSTRN